MALGIQAGTLIIAVATLFGALIGAVIPRWLQRRMERRHLRIALKKEIEKNDYYSWDIEYLKDVQPKLGPSTVYEFNVDRIGFLTDEEVEPIFDFYTEKEDFQAYLRDSSRGEGSVESDSIKESQEYAEKCRENALSALEKHLS